MQIQTFQTELPTLFHGIAPSKLQTNFQFPVLLQINEGGFEILLQLTHLVCLPPPLPATPPTATHPSLASSFPRGLKVALAPPSASFRHRLLGSAFSALVNLLASFAYQGP